MEKKPTALPERRTQEEEAPSWELRCGSDLKKQMTCAAELKRPFCGYVLW